MGSNAQRAPLTFTDPGCLPSTAASLPSANHKAKGSRPGGGHSASAARVPWRWLGALPSLSPLPHPRRWAGPALPAEKWAGPAARGQRRRRRRRPKMAELQLDPAMAGLGGGGGSGSAGLPAHARLAPRPAGTAARPPPWRSHWNPGAAARPAGSG
ncbi:hypothetical protein P7K49_011775 [Saguinus oedipus]|uniref:Uncharacterized protein n=1 Tax=Saguinus oedipus TaxID=9490 RepID=A0ABQ9VU14_SAGOE|nr:hypothetical protein P7K49_011775 [Saguinus oedipus]